MGAGKTSVGLALAAELDLPYVDLDQKIVALAGKSIPKIFHDEGESVFRDLESAALFDLSGGPPSVVATGGGSSVGLKIVLLCLIMVPFFISSLSGRL